MGVRYCRLMFASLQPTSIQLCASSPVVASNSIVPFFDNICIKYRKKIIYTNLFVNNYCVLQSTKKNTSGNKLIWERIHFLLETVLYYNTVSTIILINVQQYIYMGSIYFPRFILRLCIVHVSVSYV